MAEMTMQKALKNPASHFGSHNKQQKTVQVVVTTILFVLKIINFTCRGTNFACRNAGGYVHMLCTDAFRHNDVHAHNTSRRGLYR